MVVGVAIMVVIVGATMVAVMAVTVGVAVIVVTGW